MDRASPDYFFAQLWLEYLQHADSQAAGVPGESELPKLILDSGQLNTLPGLVITAAEATGGSAHVRIIQGVFALMYRNRAMGPDAARDADTMSRSTTREQAAQMQDAIESRLMDRAAFGAFLSALPLERREGWAILKHRRLPQPPQEREEKPTRHQSLMMAFELRVVWSRRSGA